MPRQVEQIDWNDCVQRRLRDESWAEICDAIGFQSSAQALEQQWLMARKAGLAPKSIWPKNATHGQRLEMWLYLDSKELRRLHGSGLSFREIAEKVGVPTTRTGTLGKWVRDGISGWMTLRARPAAAHPNARKQKKRHPRGRGNTTGRDYAAERAAQAALHASRGLAKVNGALARSTGHKPIATEKPRNGSNGHGDPAIRAAIAPLLPTLEELGVLHVRIDLRNRSVEIAQVKTFSLDPS